MKMNDILHNCQSVTIRKNLEFLRSLLNPLGVIESKTRVLVDNDKGNPSISPLPFGRRL